MPRCGREALPRIRLPLTFTGYLFVSHQGRAYTDRRVYGGITLRAGEMAKDFQLIHLTIDEERLNKADNRRRK